VESCRKRVNSCSFFYSQSYRKKIIRALEQSRVEVTVHENFSLVTVLLGSRETTLLPQIRPHCSQYTMQDQLSVTLTAAKKKILSVGSGDGSQQVAIFRSGHHNLVTTFYDSEKTVLSKYSTAKENINILQKDSIVLFNVDATKLHEDERLKCERFDIIIFSFPHTGAPNFMRSFCGPSPVTIKENKKLIKQFLLSAQHILTDTGEIQITLKTSAPYDSWSFPKFFGDDKFQIEERSHHNLDTSLFPGYVHRSTKGEVQGVKSVKNGNARVFVFEKKDTPPSKQPLFDSRSRTIVIHVSEVTDDDIADMAKEILQSTKEAMNVLEIRSKFGEAVRPDTRQLNRVLSRMESKTRVVKGPPTYKKPNKPTWKAINS